MPNPKRRRRHAVAMALALVVFAPSHVQALTVEEVKQIANMVGQTAGQLLATDAACRELDGGLAPEEIETAFRTSLGQVGREDLKPAFAAGVSAAFEKERAVGKRSNASECKAIRNVLRESFGISR